jgi:hypothetical protein
MTGATGGSMPVGSGRFRDHAQNQREVLGMSFSSSFALGEEGCVAHTHTLKQDQLHRHPWANDLPTLPQQVLRIFQQCERGSQEILSSVEPSLPR